MPENIEKQLNQMQDELDALRNDFDEFASIVSHDMAAPFRQIDGFADIILSRNGDKFDDKTMRHFELIVKGAKRGSRIVEALSAYSRLCTQERQLSSVNCNEVVETVLERLATLVQETGAKVRCVDMPVVVADRGQLELLFYHLIHNALHYRKPDCQPEIMINVMDNGECWEFSISDNGIGIQPNQTDTVFKVLRRAVVDKDYEGIGMGLAIARKIVQHHGGRIWVDTACASSTALLFTLSGRLDV